MGKSKKRKPNAKQRELQADWEKLLKKYQPKKNVTNEVIAWTPSKAYVRETPCIQSLPFTAEPCLKKDTPVYTGTAIKGIGTMHKSNSVPVFSDEEAIAIARMRRG
jgi:aconitase A